jgi:hypothetical protein
MVVDTTPVTDFDLWMQDDTHGIVFENNTLADFGFCREQAAMKIVVQRLYQARQLRPTCAVKTPAQ